jgi:hypothetical protein
LHCVLEIEGQSVKILGDQVKAPKRDSVRQKRGKVIVCGIQFVGGLINPVARNGVLGSHGLFLQSLDGGMQRSGVVASQSTNIIGAKNRDKKKELAALDELVDSHGKGDGVHRNATATMVRGSDK